MSGLKTIKQFFAVPDDPNLVQAQARAFTRQVPLMYGILLVNSLVLAATHDSAPDLLRLYVPGILALICIFRIAMWWRTRSQVISDQKQAGCCAARLW